MFEFLKKKISDFKEKIKAKISEEPVKVPEEPPVIKETKPAEVPIEKKSKAVQGLKKEKEPEKENVEEKPKPVSEHKPEERPKEPKPQPESKEAEPKKETEIKEEKEPQEEKPKIHKPTSFDKTKKSDKRDLKAKVSLKTKLTSLIKRTITISEKDLEALLFDLELALLESDVEQSTALEIISNLKEELTGKEIAKNLDISDFLKEEIKKSLAKVMDVPPINVFDETEKKKPYVILFLGPNGAGKTTSIAKLTHLFTERGKKVIWAASDTFRAASIEQLEEHAKRLNVRVVKHSYGSDPAAVAYDAIEAAKAHGLDVVLIDSAGRQETNRNLMEELKKIVRVTKPDLKIYIGESYAGQSMLNQAEEFDKELGIDAFILTKVDADAKGGTAISLLYKIKKPIVFLGIGQEYSDLIPFESSFILDRIV